MTYDFDQIIERKGSGCFKYDALSMIYGRDDLLPLWVADMDFAVAPEIQRALKNRLEHPVFGYNLRLPDYYRAIMTWTENHYDWEIQKQWIVSTPGVVPAIHLAIMSLTKPGDGIIIQTPVYQPFHSAVTDHNRTLLCNKMLSSEQGWDIDWEDFDRLASKAKLFILCNPHNPTGRVFKREELLRMGEICRRNGVLIFSDEIHADIVYPEHKHISISSLDGMNDICLTGFSPAKSFNLAGLATAVLVIPNPAIRDLVSGLNNKLHLYLGNSFGIRALIAAYTEAEEWLHALIAYLMSNRDFITGFLHEHFPDLPNWQPEGTFLYWVDMANLASNETELVHKLTSEAHIALDPGSKYGQGFSLYQRINFACQRSLLEEGMNRLACVFNNK